MRQSCLVSYDICDDKRLRKVFKAIRAYGDHLQYSVFECQFTTRDVVVPHRITTKTRFCSSMWGGPKGAATASSPRSVYRIWPSTRPASSSNSHHASDAICLGRENHTRH